jgi:ribosome-associated toxin RatA of RatAB toxin-antitoxin module
MDKKAVLVTLLNLLFAASLGVSGDLDLNPGPNDSLRIEVLAGEVPVFVSKKQDNVTAVIGHILVNAPRRQVWDMLADYEAIPDYIPKILSSKIVEDRGNVKVLEQVGATGFGPFRVKARMTSVLTEDAPTSLAFESIKGDFRVFRGQWFLSDGDSASTTIVTYRADIAPIFFAPAALVRFMQRRDLPEVLAAVKQRAESMRQ